MTTDAGRVCYCEERICTCSPSIAAAVERWIDPAPIVTPLSFNDSLDLAMAVAPDYDVHTLTRIAKALQAVDQASREQAKEPLLQAIAKLGQRADEEHDLYARDLAYQAIKTARGE